MCTGIETELPFTGREQSINQVYIHNNMQSIIITELLKGSLLVYGVLMRWMIGLCASQGFVMGTI